MRKIILVLVLVAFTLSGYAAKKPSWVDKRPIDKLAYIGIGFATKNEANYMELAKQRALNDLASEIKVEIQSESLLQTTEKDDVVSSYLSNNIQVSSQEDLEQFELTDSWGDKEKYWVYYRLSKLDYMDYIAARKAKIISEGYGYWVKGLEAEAQGDLPTAIEMYSKGLAAIEPQANEELKTEHQGEMVDVGIELYNSISNVLNDISIHSSVESIEMTPFQASDAVAVLSAYKGNTPLRNTKLNVNFISGAGQLSNNRTTDREGNLSLYIQNITSKDKHQEIQVILDVQQFSMHQTEYLKKSLIAFRNNTPQLVIDINLAEQEEPFKVYIKNVGRSHEMLSKSIRSLLTNNYFNVVYDEADANLVLMLKSSIKKGEKVKGEMYDFIEYFTSVEIEIIDIESAKSLVTYVVDNHRSLAPASRSQTQAETTAVREVLKKIDKGFQKELKNIDINN